MLRVDAPDLHARRRCSSRTTGIPRPCRGPNKASIAASRCLPRRVRERAARRRIVRVGAPVVGAGDLAVRQQIEQFVGLRPSRPSSPGMSANCSRSRVSCMSRRWRCAAAELNSPPGRSSFRPDEGAIRGRRRIRCRPVGGHRGFRQLPRERRRRGPAIRAPRAAGKRRPCAARASTSAASASRALPSSRAR